MRNEIFCGSASIVKNGKILLEYYIVPQYIHEDYCNIRQYGIKVKKTLVKDGGARITETKEISNVFYDEKSARKFAELIMKNKVTPVTLTDVVEDYIVSTV